MPILVIYVSQANSISFLSSQLHTHNPDWEYPGYEPHSGTPDDTVNFNLLLDDIRAALDELEAETGRYYGITAALPCGPSIIANQDIAHVGSVLTELNLMTYDFHGSWNDATGVNAPLYDQVGSPEFSVHGTFVISIISISHRVGAHDRFIISNLSGLNALILSPQVVLQTGWQGEHQRKR